MYTKVEIIRIDKNHFKFETPFDVAVWLAVSMGVSMDSDLDTTQPIELINSIDHFVLVSDSIAI